MVGPRSGGSPSGYERTSAMTLAAERGPTNGPVCRDDGKQVAAGAGIAIGRSLLRPVGVAVCRLQSYSRFCHFQAFSWRHATRGKGNTIRQLPSTSGLVCRVESFEASKAERVVLLRGAFRRIIRQQIGATPHASFSCGCFTHDQQLSFVHALSAYLRYVVLTMKST